MTMRTISVSSELQAENLLMEARRYDRNATMFRQDDDEGGFYTVCYRWNEPPRREAETGPAE